MAAQHGGVCYLRYDDTNPEAEKQVRFARQGLAIHLLLCMSICMNCAC
jgi:glutamyl/glutaminyl-tRNA synthetase